MKKVLLLGDSIRKGYCGCVKEKLKDIAEVYFPEENCRYTQYTFVELAGWIKLVENPKEVSVIHWNNGHWDVAHWDRAEKSLNSIEQYAAMLVRIYERLRTYCPNAEIIFALTTPMHEQEDMGGNPRTTAEIVRYNDAAHIVMDKLGVPVNDLFAIAQEFPSSYYADYAHFTADGYAILADAVAKVIRKKLSC